MIFQDLNNITDVYAKDGSVIERIYNRASDIIWEKIKSAINTITNYGDICWFPRFGYDKNHKFYFPFMGPVATGNTDTYLRMYRRDMNTFINSEYYGLWIVNDSIPHVNDGHIDINYILGKNRLKNPQFTSCNLLWENTTIGYFPETEDATQVNGAGYELCLDVSNLVNQFNETGGRYTYMVQRLPIYAGNSKIPGTYPNGQLYMCWSYDDILQLISDQSIYVVRKTVNYFTHEEEITGAFLSRTDNSEELFENVINQYDLEYKNIHTYC